MSVLIVTLQINYSGATLGIETSGLFHFLGSRLPPKTVYLIIDFVRTPAPLKESAVAAVTVTRSQRNSSAAGVPDITLVADFHNVLKVCYFY